MGNLEKQVGKLNNKYAEKWNRVMGIFCRGIIGQQLSVEDLANEYQVSTKTITRDIAAIKKILTDNFEQLGNASIDYSRKSNRYFINMDGFLDNKEVFALVEILIGSRVLHKDDLAKIVNKLKRFTNGNDSVMLGKLIGKELLHYSSVKLDYKEDSFLICNKTTTPNYLIDNIWTLTNAIYNRKEISISYYKMNQSKIERRIIPLSIMVNEYYFYLIATSVEDEILSPRYFRIDRITEIVEHRTPPKDINKYYFDEGDLRAKSQFMWPGRSMTVEFEFTGPSLQAILDRLPTAKYKNSNTPGKYIITADVYGDGIKMYLMSQGSWVKVLRPQRLVEEMNVEIAKMRELYSK